MGSAEEHQRSALEGTAESVTVLRQNTKYPQLQWSKGDLLVWLMEMERPTWRWKTPHLEPDGASSLLPQLVIIWGYFSFHCWPLTFPSPTHSFSFLLFQLCTKGKAYAWTQFLPHWGSSPAAQCPTCQQASCSLTLPLHHSFAFLNRDHKILKQTPPSRLLPFRGSLVTYEISLFSMQTVTATLTLQTLQQQTLCHCKSVKFSESV